MVFHEQHVSSGWEVIRSADWSHQSAQFCHLPTLKLSLFSSESVQGRLFCASVQSTVSPFPPSHRKADITDQRAITHVYVCRAKKQDYNIIWHFLADMLIHLLENQFAMPTACLCVRSRDIMAINMLLFHHVWAWVGGVICFAGKLNVCCVLEHMKREQSKLKLPNYIFFDWNSQTHKHTEEAFYKLAYPTNGQPNQHTALTNWLTGTDRCVLQHQDFYFFLLWCVRSAWLCHSAPLTDYLAAPLLCWVAANKMVALIVEGCWLPLIWPSRPLRIHAIALPARPRDSIVCAKYKKIKGL